MNKRPKRVTNLYFASRLMITAIEYPDLREEIKGLVDTMLIKQPQLVPHYFAIIDNSPTYLDARNTKGELETFQAAMVEATLEEFNKLLNISWKIQQTDENHPTDSNIFEFTEHIIEQLAAEVMAQSIAKMMQAVMTGSALKPIDSKTMSKKFGEIVELMQTRKWWADNLWETFSLCDAQPAEKTKHEEEEWADIIAVENTQ